MLKGNKRGNVMELFLNPLFEMVILLTLVLIPLMHYSEQIRKDETFERNYIARDLALLMETIQLGRGEITAYYRENTRDYTIYFEKDMVRLMDSTDKKIPSDTGTKFPYTKDSRINIAQKSLNDKNENTAVIPVIVKTNKIEFYDSTSEEIPKMAGKLTCPATETSNENWKDVKFLIDPARGGNDPGDANKDDPSLTQSMAASRIAYSLYTKLRDMEAKNIAHTRSGTDPETLSDDRPRSSDTKSKAIESDIVISIHIGTGSSGANDVRAYINTEASEESVKRSQKLACLMLNSFMDQGIDVKVTEPEKLLKREFDTDTQLLLEDGQNKDRVFVMLEIGNVQADKRSNMLMSYSKLGNAIFKGIEAFFK